MTAFLYSLTVLIWGTTWIAIHAQLGPVPVEISIVYRFALAGLTLFALLLATGKLQKLALRDQPFVLLQALCLFSCNFLCFYTATAYVPSGIVSVVFSAATIFNLVNGFLFLGRRPTARIVAGALIGVAGIACLFWQVLHEADLSPETAQGLALSLLGTWFFSLGNIVSARNQARGLPLTTTNAWAMLYGAGIVTLFALARGVPFAFDTSPLYLGSLVYLAIPGSVIGFTAYLTVVHRLGPEKAAYMTVLFPVVALTISVFVENYQPTGAAALGLVLVLLGNVLVLLRRPSGPAKQTRTINPDSADAPGTGLTPARQA